MRGENLFLIYFSFRFFLRSTKIGSQVFVGTEGTVDLRVNTKILEFRQTP